MESESIAGVGSDSSSSSLDERDCECREQPDPVCVCICICICFCVGTPSAEDDLVNWGEGGTESGGRRLAGWVRGDDMAEEEEQYAGGVGVREDVKERLEALDVWEDVDPDRLSSVWREEDKEWTGWMEGNEPRRSDEAYPVESDPALTLVVRIFSGNVLLVGCPTPPPIAPVAPVAPVSVSVSVVMLCLR